MADNVTANAGTGGATFATDDIAGVAYPRAKVGWGADGTFNDADIASGKALPVQLRDASGVAIVPATAAKQPALGTAGSASTDVVTIQGIASGTVVPISVATIPSHAVTNAGTFAVQAGLPATVDTNSGVKSASTLRVVLATDQPALTAKLLVTPDSVALPANQSVNINQIVGTTADVNSGVKSAGTLRVVLATDQPALTAKLLVTPDSVALPANQSCNVAQINGITPLMGAGNTGTGSPRVTISTDQVAIPVTVGAAATSIAKAEDAAHTTSDVGAMALGVRESTPTDLSAGNTDGDYEPFQVSRDGAIWVSGVAAPKGGWLIATGSIGNTKTDIGTANTAGQVGGWYFYNPNAAVSYVQFFNTQASGVTLGTTAPVYSLGVPALGAANVAPGMVGLNHATAISIAVTTTRAGLTNTTSTVDYNIWYKQ